MNNLKKILIVEDEPLIASHIETILEESGYDVIDKVREAEQALKVLEIEQVHLILLDISLKGDTDGVELAQIINQKIGIPFIFLTSHFDDATVNRLKKTNPAGFILKPFNEKELLTQISIALYNNSVEDIKSPENKDHIFVKYNAHWIKIPYDKICFAKADDIYTLIHTPEKNYLVSYPLKKIEENLPSQQFLRVHKSFIVNIAKIDSISDRNIHINQHQIPIGRLFFDDFMKKLNKL